MQTLFAPSVSLFLNVQSTHTHAHLSEKSKFIGRHRVITLAAHNASKLAGELYSVEKCNKSTRTRIGGLNLSGGARAPAINRLCVWEKEQSAHPTTQQPSCWCTWPGANRTQIHIIYMYLYIYTATSADLWPRLHPSARRENRQPLPFCLFVYIAHGCKKRLWSFYYGVAKCRLRFSWISSPVFSWLLRESGDAICNFKCMTYIRDYLICIYIELHF